MRKIILLLTTITLALTACEKENYPNGFGEMPGEQQEVSNLIDPALAWSSDSFEVTLIKASSQANKTYSASSASYLLTVVSKSGGDGGPVGVGRPGGR